MNVASEPLAAALSQIGLLEMAHITRTGYYYDGFKLKTRELIKHLSVEAEKTGDGVKRHRIHQLVYEVQQGFFDIEEPAHG